MKDDTVNGYNSYMQKKSTHEFVLLLLVTLLLAACASASPTESPENTPAQQGAAAATATTEPTPEPTATNAPTAEPTATAESSADSGSGGIDFDGARAFDQLMAQADMGPRFPGSPGHIQVRDYIEAELAAQAWIVERQEFDYQGFAAQNIIGRKNSGRDLPIVILAAHYDTRAISDQSPGFEAQAGLGAVDGASGVAVLLELAMSLDMDIIDREIWLTFFDVEDNGSGGIEGWQWIAGSSYMAENLESDIQSMVLVDMIGDADQNLHYEGYSDAALREELWNIAAELGYSDYFIPNVKYTMIDDHLPFVQQGIPAVDIIDFDYEYWHTIEDTPDKASPDSLLRVGRVIETWLER